MDSMECHPMEIKSILIKIVTILSSDILIDLEDVLMVLLLNLDNALIVARIVKLALIIKIHALLA